MSNKLKLNTKDESLREILGNSKKYFVPKFQRDYTWETEHWEIFWEDIENLLNNEDDEYHYMGYLVLQEPRANQFRVVDGQQRLTTFSILVLAAIKRLKEAGNEEERIAELHNNFIGNKDLISLKMTNKLTLNINNNYYFNEAVIGNPLPQRGQKKTVLLMGKALTYFYDVLKNKTGEDIGRIIDKVSHHLLFTTIYIGSDLNAYKIFETLNARGSQLSSGDLLKNYIFSLIDANNDIPDEVLDKLEEKWGKIGGDIGDNHYTDYILCDWNSTHKLVRKASLFKAIKGELDTSGKADGYLNKLASNSQTYAALLDNENDFWKDHPDYTDIKQDLYALRLFNIRQPISLLFAAYLNHRQDFATILRWIVNFSIRYNVICRAHAGEQESLYNAMCLSLNQHRNKGSVLPDIKQSLQKRYPSDDKFRRDFIDKTMPTAQSNKKARFLLARLAEETPHSINEAALTVEHILPREPTNQWIDHFGENWKYFTQRIGNLGLVSATENNQLGQKTFVEKKDILKMSPYSINHDVSEYADWNPENIESRQTHLAERAVKLWKIN